MDTYNIRVCNNFFNCCNFKRRGGPKKMNLIYLIEDLLTREKKQEEEWEPEPLYLEDIRPEDLPPHDGPFPKPPPNKRVIIIDM